MARTAKLIRPQVTPCKRKHILERDDYRCQRCFFDGRRYPVALTIDHVVAVSKGGNSKSWNLQVLCLNCNVIKADADPTLAELQQRDARRNGGA